MIKNYAIVNTKLLSNSKVTRIGKLSIICAILVRNLLLKFILCLLSYLVPKNNKILFFSSVGNYNFPLWADEKDYQFKENPKYLAIYSAKKLKAFHTVFHAPNKKLFAKIAGLGIQPVRGFTAFWYMLRAKYLFVDNNNFLNPNASFLIGNFQIIQCCHGTALKNIDNRKTKTKKEQFNEKLKQIEFHKFKYIISACDHATEITRKYYHNTKILKIGYPRNDIFFDKSFFETDRTPAIWEFKQFEKVLLYAPTFRELGVAVNPFSYQMLNRLNALLSCNNYLLLIKQHPYAGKTELDKDYSNIVDVTNNIDDIQELLVNIDVLISDYSGCVFDFSLTEKLQLFYPFDIKNYMKNRGDFYFEYSEKNLPGAIVSSEDDLIYKIEQLERLIEDENIKSRVRKFKNKFNHCANGNSCKRLFQELKITGGKV